MAKAKETAATAGPPNSLIVKQSVRCAIDFVPPLPTKGGHAPVGVHAPKVPCRKKLKRRSDGRSRAVLQRKVGEAKKDNIDPAASEAVDVF